MLAFGKHECASILTTSIGVTAMTKTTQIAEYRAALASNPAWAHRALVVLHDQQTRDEQETRTTETHNGVGFTGIDAEILSSFAEQVKRGRTLSPKQLAIAHRRLPKYAGQLWRLAQQRVHPAPAPAPAPAPRDCPQCERQDCFPGEDLCATCLGRNRREEELAQDFTQEDQTQAEIDADNAAQDARDDMDWWEFQTSCYPEGDSEGDMYPRDHEDQYPEFDE
jgi:hypothetical protein